MSNALIIAAASIALFCATVLAGWMAIRVEDRFDAGRAITHIGHSMETARALKQTSDRPRSPPPLESLARTKHAHPVIDSALGYQQARARADTTRVV